MALNENESHYRPRVGTVLATAGLARLLLRIEVGTLIATAGLARFLYGGQPTNGTCKNFRARA